MSLAGSSVGSSAHAAQPVDSPATRPLVALVGRPNAGKSALFNRLTGGSARVGNFPGITVEVLEGEATLPSGRPVRVVDLPGVYSLVEGVDPATDEGVARSFLQRGGDDVVSLRVQVVDASRLGLGLRLTRELIALGGPLLVAVTQCDVLQGEGRELDTGALSKRLGVPVVALSARDPRARDALSRAIGEALDRPSVAGATGDWAPDTLAQQVVRDRRDADARAVQRRQVTDRLDRWLLHPLLGPLLFVGLLSTVFAAVFLIADPASSAIDALLGALAGLIGPLLGDGWLRSLVVDGLLGGVGTVLTFMPQIVVLALALEALEATGYMARGAFLIDRLLRAAGLGGRSFVPLLMGHACAVPAITATRIVRNPYERLVTMLVVPLTTCSARIPTYALLVAAFFPAAGALQRAGIFIGLYFAGLLLSVLVAAVLRRSAVRGRGLPMVLEMPAYRAPEARAMWTAAARTAGSFARDVGRTIVVASLVLWALLQTPWPGSAAEDPAAAPVERSVAARLGQALEPVTQPLGFDWRINVGLIGSFGARELMVSTLGVINGLEDVEDDPQPLAERLQSARRSDGSPAYPLGTGLALLAFFVVACQCTSTVAAIRRETGGWKWPLFTLVYTYGLAWLLAWAVRTAAMGLGQG